MQRSSVFTSLPGLLKPTWEGAQGGTSSAIQADSCGLGILLAFCVKQVISASFLSSIRLSAKSFRISLYISLTLPSTIWTPWIQPRLDPNKGPLPCFVGKRILEFPLQFKIRRSQFETREEFQGLCHHFKRTWCANPFQINLIPLQWLDCHPEYRLKTQCSCDSPVAPLE